MTEHDNMTAVQLPNEMKTKSSGPIYTVMDFDVPVRAVEMRTDKESGKSAGSLRNEIRSNSLVFFLYQKHRQKASTKHNLL